MWPKQVSMKHTITTKEPLQVVTESSKMDYISLHGAQTVDDNLTNIVTLSAPIVTKRR